MRREGLQPRTDRQAAGPAESWVRPAVQFFAAAAAEAGKSIELCCLMLVARAVRPSVCLSVRPTRLARLSAYTNT